MSIDRRGIGNQFRVAAAAIFLGPAFVFLLLWLINPSDVMGDFSSELFGDDDPVNGAVTCETLNYRKQALTRCEFEDGLECVVSYAGGISCDWGDSSDE